MSPARLMLAVLAVCAVATPVLADPAAKAAAALNTHCVRCHGQDGAAEGGFDFAGDLAQLVRRGKVVPGQPEKSKVLKRMLSEDDPMPPADEKVRPTAADIAAVRDWVAAGAPAPGAVAAKDLSPSDVLALMRKDADAVPVRDRRFVRYFTLAHLARAGVPAADVQAARHGVAKLVNSLSWGPRVVSPAAVDPAGTVLRIDLRDYQWTAATWDLVVAADPYAVDPGSADARALSGATGCRVPAVRGDWFAAAAARPPLYHDILALPGTDRELETLLRVDVAANLASSRAARAGFNGSGVSRNNRLVERHEAGAVVYWKSYDFLANTGRGNLFAHPTGPGDAPTDFKHDGGEIIFNLPNGLQGYFLTDGAGKRIDKGPTAVVSDPRRPDRAVENGLSCISCHAQGMIPKADQVRAHVRQHTAAFDATVVDAVDALYPPAEQFAELIKKDSERFRAALVKTGAAVTGPEPVSALALRFEAELDLAAAAGEACVSPAELTRAVTRSAELGRLLGPLAVSGGTVQRAVFTDAFPDLAAELRLGAHTAPRAAAAAKLVRDADALAKAGDLPGAVTGYAAALKTDPRSAVAHNNRGLARKRQGDIPGAITDFSAAIALDATFAAAVHNRGSARHAGGDLPGALADYTDAVRLDDTSAVAFTNRGFARLESGAAADAVKDLDRALALRPNFPAALNNRGLAHTKLGSTAKAVADFTAAIDADPKFAKAYYNRAAAHDLAGDPNKAAADRRWAAELDPALADE